MWLRGSLLLALLPLPRVTAGSAGRGGRAAAPRGVVAPSGTALPRSWDLAQMGAWGAEGASHSPGQHPVLAEQSWDGCRCCPRRSVLPPLPRVWLIRRQRGYSRAVPPWALFFFSLLSLLFNEPTLEDLERRSCSFSVTYLPASAPYSAEGINLCSRRGAERRARPAARRRLHNSRRGRGGLPGGGRGVDVEHSAPRLMAFPAWSRKKKVPLQQGTSW